MIEEFLQSVRKVTIRQLIEWGEILTGWETRNRYGIHDESGNLKLAALEMSQGVGGFFLRQYSRTGRPFTIVLTGYDGREQLRVVRPWRWFLSYAEVQEPDGSVVGYIQQRFAFFTRRMDFYRGDGRPLGRLIGPLLHPWTFSLKRGPREIGAIRKKFSGLLKEAFTDADNFVVEFSSHGAADDLATRKMLLGATFLVDIQYFERRND